MFFVSFTKKQMKSYRISFVGSGSVGGALCREFFTKKHTIVQIASRSGNSAIELSSYCKATPVENLNFDRECDIIIVSVPDYCLKKVIKEIRYTGNPVIAHTAGSYGLDVFPDHIKRKGVFYPLQTFSKERKVNISNVPFFLEASDRNTMDELKNIASILSNSVYESDENSRRMLHLAAVFACNFTNHMYILANMVCNKTPYAFNVMEPLIMETACKAIEIGPENAQTGPAIRNDIDTLKKHLKLLSFSSEMKSIYKIISNSIIEYYKNR